MNRAQFVTELKQHIGYAFRMMRRTPAFTAAALLTLALGIAANSAIFSVVNGVPLQSLPFRDAERLHVLQMYPDGTKYSSMSAPDFMSVRADQRVFDHVEAIDTRALTLLGAGGPREVNGAFVSDGMLDLLGVKVTTGRAFLGGIIRNQLFGVTVFDPTTLISVVGVLMASAVLARLLPASRAARIDPVTAFRQS